MAKTKKGFHESTCAREGKTKFAKGILIKPNCELIVTEFVVPKAHDYTQGPFTLSASTKDGNIAKVSDCYIAFSHSLNIAQQCILVGTSYKDEVIQPNAIASALLNAANPFSTVVGDSLVRGDAMIVGWRTTDKGKVKIQSLSNGEIAMLLERFTR